MSTTRRPDPAASGWSGYLSEFHAARPGITEALLTTATDDAGATPYGWLAQAVPPGARVLDLACGSAPTGDLLRSAGYLGLDLSTDELRLAVARRLPVVRADAGSLPLPDDSVDAVVCSMSLQLLPLTATLAEVARVLRPGGTVAATLPAARPMPVRDLLRWARLLLALRRGRLAYPNDAALAAPADAFAAAGLTVVADESRPFGVDVVSPGVADRLLDGLYLPGVAPERLAAARAVARRWVGGRTTVPVRRLLARR